MPNALHYSDYLQLDTILHAQSPESDKQGQPAHDEMLFIIIHQTYELWFKQLLFEINSVNSIMLKPALNDNSPELQTVVHRLERCVTILKVLVHQIDIMETMTAMDFLDFRNLLRPASGFQSVQFKLLEARLGLKYEYRHGQEYYISQLRPQEVEEVKKGEREKSSLELVNSWLERMPFFDEQENWSDFLSTQFEEGVPIFWSTYRDFYKRSLASEELANLEAFNNVFLKEDRAGQLSAKASRAALFIMLYRGYPILQLPFQLLDNLLEIDEQLSTWRFRHMNMVNRMIGSRIGTGGSTGKDYLKAALDKHYIFKEIAQLTSFLLERSRLPQLGIEMERRLGFLQAS